MFRMIAMPLRELSNTRGAIKAREDSTGGNIETRIRAVFRNAGGPLEEDRSDTEKKRTVDVELVLRINSSP